jgi:hypothetical protein
MSPKVSYLAISPTKRPTIMAIRKRRYNGGGGGTGGVDFFLATVIGSNAKFLIQCL